MDESHYLQTLTSQRSKRILGRGGILENCVYKFMLSGTPMANRPIDLFPMLYTLANDIIAPYNTYEKYASRFCGGWKDSWGNLIAKGATHLDDLRERIKKFMLRRIDVGNLPEISYDLIPLMQNERTKDVITLESVLSFEAVNGMRDLNNLGDMASLRQQVAMAKLPECVQFIKDTMTVVDKLVVFYYHKAVGEKLFQTLAEYGVENVRGGMAASKKQLIIMDFIKNPETRIFLAQFQAAGESVDGLHKVCNHGVFVEASWIPKDILQAAGRLRRMDGLGKPVLIQFLAAAGTIEYQILGSMIHKRQIIREVIG